MIRTTLLGTAAVFALAAAAPLAAQTVPAPAQTAEATIADPAEIVVTAQKRRERLQDVPVAVSVISGDTLAAQGKVSLEGAQYLVPSLNFLKSGTTLNQSLFLRGVGTATFSIAGEPSVSTVLDGVVYSRSGEAFGDLVDIERIEVLRGPQGTLFGKNASAGVINITSKRPGDKFAATVEGGFFFDNGNEYRVKGAVDVPFSPAIRGRLTGFYDKYDGNIFNVAPTVNRKVNGYEHYGARGLVEADASETIKLTFIADWHRNKDDCCAEVIAGAPLTGTGAVNTANLALIQTVLPTLQGADTRAVNQNLVTATKETGYGFSGQADIELGDHTLTSITAYRNYKNTEIRDGDFLPQAYIGFNQLHDFGPQTGDTISQELRLTSPAKQFLTYVVGAYYSRAKSERIFTRNDIVCAGATGAVLPVGVLTPCTSPLAAPSTFPSGTADFGSTFKNFAVFGQGTANVSERFRFIGGLRYTHDELDVFHSRRTALAGPGINGNFDQGVFASVAPGLPNGDVTKSNGVPFAASQSKDNVSGKAGFQYDISRAATTYFTYARGYKGPAYNVFFNLTATGTNSIAAETSNAFEAGLKTTLDDGRLTVNVALYTATYYNFQANNPDLAGGVVVTRFTNAGKVRTSGAELDLAWRPVTGLSISGGVAYTDAHVVNFKLPVGGSVSGVIPSGTPLGFAPEYKGNATIDYRLKTGGPVDIGFNVQGSFQSSELSLFSPDPILRRAGTIGPYGLLNLTATLYGAEDRYKLAFQVRNLTDKSFAAAIANGGPGGAYRYQIPRDADRYFGITGTVNF